MKVNTTGARTTVTRTLDFMGRSIQFRDSYRLVRVGIRNKKIRWITQNMATARRQQGASFQLHWGIRVGHSRPAAIPSRRVSCRSAMLQASPSGGASGFARSAWMPPAKPWPCASMKPGSSASPSRHAERPRRGRYGSGPQLNRHREDQAWIRLEPVLAAAVVDGCAAKPGHSNAGKEPEFPVQAIGGPRGQVPGAE
jgi:hypothetical protein